MNSIELTALDGRLALGFLAACGTLRLLDEAASDKKSRPRLRWDDHHGTAVLETDNDLEEVVEILHNAACSIGDGGLLPGGPVGFPGVSKEGVWEGSDGWPRGDPIRMPASCFRSVVADGWRNNYGDDFIDTWVPALVTDQSSDDAGCVELSPFAAPSGQQTFATMFRKPLEMVREHPEYLRDALTRWRRVDGVTGEYFDHHVLRSAADRTDGKSMESGVPGATWLALMAMPWLPVWSNGQRPLAGAWQHRRRSRPILTWPLWSAPINADGVQVLIVHPRLAVIERGRDEAPAVDLASLRALDVFMICAADRRSISGRTFAGVLTPVEIDLGFDDRDGKRRRPRRDRR